MRTSSDLSDISDLRRRQSSYEIVIYGIYRANDAFQIVRDVFAQFSTHRPNHTLRHYFGKTVILVKHLSHATNISHTVDVIYTQVLSIKKKGALRKQMAKQIVRVNGSRRAFE